MATKNTHKKAAQRKASGSTGTSLADVVRLGLNAATIKSQSKPADWKSAVKAAHSQGYTVASAVDPSIPAELKARLKSSLNSEATKNVNAAYAPGEQSLQTQETQNNGLRLKRLQDEQSFNSWYAQRQSEANAAIQSAQQKYQDYMTGQAATAQTNATQNATDAQKLAQQGQSSDLSNSIYTKDAAAREQVSADAAKTQASGAVASGISTALQMNRNTASVSGRHDQEVGRIETDYGKTASDLASQRVQLTAAKASDTIKAYTDLLDKESTKANAVQQNSIASATLTQKESQSQQQNDQFYAGIKARDAISARSAKTATANSVRTSQTAKTVAQINSEQKQLDRDLRKTEGAKDRANALRVAAMRHPTGADGKPSDAAVKNSVAQVGVIHSLADIVKRHGDKFRDAHGHVTTTRDALISRGFNGAQINAGVMLAQTGHINDQLARQLGILPQQRG